MTITSRVMIAVRMPGARLTVRVDCVSLVQAGLDRLPERWRALLLAHRELMKFAVVGAITWFVDTGVVYALKLTVLPDKPLTARAFGVLIATIVSYILNREWSFKGRGGREKHHEALLFFMVSAIGVLLSNLPLWVSRYFFHLHVPDVSLTVENIADFVSAFIIGNILQMVFRFWAMKRWVFPDEIDALVEEFEELYEEEKPLGFS